MSLQLAAIYCYPVKSLGEISLTESKVDRFGLVHDRRWMVVDELGYFLTQRQLPGMVKIGVTRSGRYWRLQCGDASVVFSESSVSRGTPLTVTVWGDAVVALPAGSEVNDWLSAQLERTCRLVYMPDTTHRRVDPDYAHHQQTVSFADGFPILLTSVASLEDFNRHLNQPAEMLRFRPNLVIGGGSPWQEDEWQRIRIGALEFEVVKPCSRCAIPTINRQTAVREPEVFRALKAHRGRNGEVYFGQNLLSRQTGLLQVGDSVEILA